ncbi:hypothetical protein Cni_G05040 [Canna indica]|uniref:K Homology domain-containing protein n=1 Tax=Canna indica TaxID=4628 RepID=A0AAQ3JTU0_9LILI|nr:hypothetical protein Cni_G05040 [Canna indica]
MEGLKRPLDVSAGAGEANAASPSPSSSSSSSASASKRRNASAAAGPFRSPPPPLSLRPSPAETVFRMICPAEKAVFVIGKGGAFVRQCREETGARIRVEDPIPGSDDRVIVVGADAKPKRRAEGGGGEAEADASPAQRALIRVFEQILRAAEDRLVEHGGFKEEEIKGTVVCRLLAQSSQIGCVLGKGGKVVEKIRHESGAQVRVLGKDQVPTCASVGDELIQISGSFSSVKKALFSVSSCLQDNPRTETTNSTFSKHFGTTIRGAVSPVAMDPYSHRGYLPSPHVPEYHLRGYATNPGVEINPSGHRKILEEEIIFRMLCSNDKVRSIIGKGGIIIRTMQNETGASIKILDPVPDSDERVIAISAHEISELGRSPSQDAVLCVHSRLSEAVDKGSPMVARLLVPAQQIGCLLGKGGNVIAEMRRATGASIRIFVREQVPRCALPNDEVVQVTGTFQCVQDALHLITSKIRETIFPPKNYPNVGIGQFIPATYEMPSPLPRSRHELNPSGLYPPMNISNSADRSGGLHNTLERQPPLSQSADQPGVERSPCFFGNEAPGPHPATDCAAATPRVSEIANGGNTRNSQDSGASLDTESGLIGSGGQAIRNKTVEVVVPQQYLGFVNGDNGHTLDDIREISGAKVAFHEPKPGATEGKVVISGTIDRVQTAQSLLHAFILCGLERN